MSDPTRPGELPGSSQRRHFFSWNPQFTTGDLLQIAGLCVLAGIGYGVYQGDKASTLKELEFVKLSAANDRQAVKDQLAAVREESKELRTDVKAVAAAVNEISRTVYVIKAQQDATTKGKQ